MPHSEDAAATPAMQARPYPRAPTEMTRAAGARRYCLGAVIAAAIDDDDLARQLARDLRNDSFDGLSFVEGRDDDSGGYRLHRKPQFWHGFGGVSPAKAARKSWYALPFQISRKVCLGGITEGVGLVAARGKRRNAAWQRAAMCGEVHQRPRTATGRPRGVFLCALQTGAGLGRARGIDRDAKLASERLCRGDGLLFLALGFFEQRRLFAREPAAEIVKDQAL